MAKDMVKGPKGKGYMGGGKDTGFVTTPTQTTSKKGFKR